MQLIKLNWFTKVISLALAVMVWMHVRKLENRIQRTVLLPVNVTAPSGQRVVEPPSNTTVQVDLEGPAELVRSIKDEEIELQFDATSVRPGERRRVPVYVQLPEKYDRLNRLMVTWRPQTIPVRFESDATEQFSVSLKPLNRLDGWEWRQPPQPEPSKITITGPREAVNRVAKVVAEFAVEATDRVNQLVTLQALDKQDKSITDEVHLEPAQVMVTGIQQRVVFPKRVPVQPIFEAPSGARISVDVTPKRVTITGPGSKVSEIYVVETERIQVPPGQAQFTETVSLVSPAQGVEVSPASVQVTVRLQTQQNKPPAEGEQ